MSSFADNMKNLGTGRLAAMAGTGISVIAAVGLFSYFVSRPALSPVYTGLDPAESSQIVQVIEGLEIPYEVSADGSTIQIPRTDFGQVRMAAAGQQLPSENAMGYEIFDTNSSLGMNTFMQKANMKRAIEGELARTIKTLRGVESARVHIVMPDREAFSREEPEPTASVVIRMSSAGALDRAKALTIRHLVASSVPKLKPSNVTVGDSTGELILGADGNASGESAVDSARAAVEARIERNLEALLAASFGRGNVRVQVSAEIDKSRQVVTQRTFDPAAQVPRSTQTISETESDARTADNVTVEQNLPGAEVGAGPTDKRERSRTEESVNYEIGSTTTESVIEPGGIERLTIAVLLNGTYQEDADGNRVYEARSDDELDRVADLVRSAAGVDEMRGDKVTVDSLEFVELALEEEAEQSAFMRMLTENMMTIVQWILALVAFLVLILVVVRPVLQKSLTHTASEEPEESSESGGGDGDGEKKPANDGEKSASGSTGSEDDDDDDDAEMVQIENIKGDLQKKKVEAFTGLVSDHHDESLKIIKAWLAQESQ